MTYQMKNAKRTTKSWYHRYYIPVYESQLFNLPACNPVVTSFWCSTRQRTINMGVLYFDSIGRRDHMTCIQKHTRYTAEVLLSLTINSCITQHLYFPQINYNESDRQRTICDIHQIAGYMYRSYNMSTSKLNPMQRMSSMDKSVTLIKL